MTNLGSIRSIRIKEHDIFKTSQSSLPHVPPMERRRSHAQLVKVRNVLQQARREKSLPLRTEGEENVKHEKRL